MRYSNRRANPRVYPRGQGGGVETVQPTLVAPRAPWICLTSYPDSALACRVLAVWVKGLTRRFLLDAFFHTPAPRCVLSDASTQICRTPSPNAFSLADVSSQISPPRCLLSDTSTQMIPPRYLLPDASSHLPSHRWLLHDNRKFRVSCWCVISMLVKAAIVYRVASPMPPTEYALVAENAGPIRAP